MANGKGASAQDTVWPSHAATWGDTDSIILGAAVFSGLLAHRMEPQKGLVRWGQNRFDGAARSFLSARSKRGQQVARTISDITLLLSVASPLLFDSVLDRLLGAQDDHASKQIFLISLQTQAIVYALQSWSNVLARPRPYTTRCKRNEGISGCDKNRDRRSFFSGHTSHSFAAATNSCVFHATMPQLYGGDIVPCVTNLALATATGILRVVGDLHYLSDVITGAAVGILLGALVPLLKTNQRATNSDIVTKRFSVALTLPLP